MAPLLLRIFIGGLLIVHGFAHWELTTVWGSKPTPSSWLLSPRGVAQSSLNAISTPLWIVPLLIFVSAGFALFFGAEWWRWLAMIGAMASLLAMAIFGHRMMLLGVAVDIAILIALLGSEWPSPSLLGA